MRSNEVETADAPDEPSSTKTASGGEQGGIDRRSMLAGTLAAVGSAVLAGLPDRAVGQSSRLLAAAATPTDPTRILGSPTRAVGERSSFVHAVRTPTGETAGNSLTPLHQLTGTITPSDLHFERHHAGVPQIDPARHRLVIHGLVERPMLFSLDDLQRFPAVTRTHFVECSGNGRNAYRGPKREMTPQQVDGLTSNSEWTGVPLSLLLAEAGLQPDGAWMLAEGSDACLMARSIPIRKALDDALVVFGQNGEPLRPEQGYPMRLLLPGWEGNMSVKWLRRLKIGREPFMTRWETSKYTDPLPNDTARMFSFEMDAKSIITAPAYPTVLSGPGWWPVTGIAWTGRGSIARVDVSTDGGRSWSAAELQGPVLPKAHTRFRHMWKWTGGEAVLMSRATDETGYVQPTRTELLRVRGSGTDFHFNPIRGWRVLADGRVFFEGDS